ncbi:MAG: TetR/AcrR family transcriptional regulator [Alphaproteobacteria bacterium]
MIFAKKIPTQDKILTAATDLFGLNGYHGVSVDDICAEAGVKKGSFYHYFPSKVDVFLAAFQREWAAKRVDLDRVFSPTLLPAQRLEQFSALIYEKQAEKTAIYGKVLGCPFACCGSEMSTQEERIRTYIAEIFTINARYFESLLRDSYPQQVPAAEEISIIAQEMMAYVMGVLTQAKIKNDLSIIKRDLEKGLLRYIANSNNSD